MAHLQLISPNLKGVRIELNSQEITVGRDHTNTISIQDSGILPRHCILKNTEKGHQVISLSQDNELLVNKQNCSKAYLLHGDIILLGKIELIYCNGKVDTLSQEPVIKIPTFKPNGPKISKLDFVAWIFSPTAKLKFKYQAGINKSDDVKLIQSLEKLTRKLLDRDDNKLETQILISNVILFLAWNQLSHGNLNKTAELLHLYFIKFVVNSDLTAIRWSLLEALWNRKEIDDFITQARYFLMDPIVSDARFKPAVLYIVTKLYESVSPAACSKAIKNACPQIQDWPDIEWLKYVCDCPSSFTAKEEALQWLNKINSSTFNFSRTIEADAHLIMARAAEANQDWESMINAALNALRISPTYNPALYWLARAKLYITNSSPEEHLKQNIAIRNDSWARMQLLIKLHKTPSLVNAYPMIKVLEGKAGTIDVFEGRLVVSLLKNALELDSLLALSEIQKASQICIAIEKVTGELPWTQILIAYKEARVDLNYVGALERLEKNSIHDTSSAKKMARLICILVGSPQQFDDKKCKTSIGALEVIMRGVIGKKIENKDQIESIRQSLPKIYNTNMFRLFPELTAVTQVLELGFDLLYTSRSEIWTKLQTFKLDFSAPEWVVWLYTRIKILIHDMYRPEKPIELSRIDIPAVSWFLECWIKNNSICSLIDKNIMKNIQDNLEDWSKTHSNQVITKLRKARSFHYRHSDCPSQPTSYSFFSELGDLASKACSSEMYIELNYSNARQMLASGAVTEALKLLKSLEPTLEIINPIVAQWWTPLVRYWIGVTQASMAQENAAETLKSLLNGPRNIDARAQLALLCLKEAKIQDASKWIEDTSLNIPSVRYTKALLFVRRNKLLEAKQLLESEETQKILHGSPYDLAAKRLLAAMEERFGSAKESMKVYREILKKNPNDTVTLIRYGRGLLKQTYQMFLEHRLIKQDHDTDHVRDIISKTKTTIHWWRSYQLLFELLLNPMSKLPNLEALLSDWNSSSHEFPFRQLSIFRLLENKKTTEALSLAGTAEASQSPQWFKKTSVILKSWEILGSVYSKFVSSNNDKEINIGHLDKLVYSLKECEESFQCIQNSQQDSELGYWFSLIRYARYFMESNSQQQEVGDCQDGLPSPINNICRLWSSNAQQRQESAHKLDALVQTDHAWDEPQELFLKALIAYTLSREDEYLTQYEYLEPILENLPISGIDFWFSTAQIRYKKKDWQYLLESELPECVSDLSHPLVRMIIGFSYANAATNDYLNNKIPDALRKLSQAKVTLECLCEQELSEK